MEDFMLTWVLRFIVPITIVLAIVVLMRCFECAKLCKNNRNDKFLNTCSIQITKAEEIELAQIV